MSERRYAEGDPVYAKIGKTWYTASILPDAPTTTSHAHEKYRVKIEHSFKGLNGKWITYKWVHKRPVHARNLKRRKEID